jgi:hypothetical protein
MKKIISLLLVLTMCVLSLASCGGGNSSPEGVVELAMELYENPSAKTLKKLLPDEVWEVIIDDEDMDEDEFWDEMDENMEDAMDEMEDMDGFKFSFEITDVDDMKKSEVKDLNEELEDYLDDDIDGAAVVTVELTYSFEYDGEEFEEDTEIEFTVFEYDGSWYIVPDDLGMFM